MPYKKLAKIFGLSLLVLLASILTFIIILYLGGFGKIPSQKDLNELQQESATLVYSEEGELIGKYFAENRTNVSFDTIPETLIQALIATEDARFYEHDGVDSRSMLRVLYKSILLGDERSGGGSTISQQLAKNLFGRKDYGKISLVINKIKEIILANRIEEIYSKNEILELYLNTVPFGENVYGIEAASKRYFNKHCSKLKTEESAVLIGLLKANSYYNPRSNPEQSKQRRNTVLQQMAKYEYLNAKAADSLQKLDLKLDYFNLKVEQNASYFMKRLRLEAQSILNELDSTANYDLEKDGLVIKSSLNLSLQKAALNSMKSHLQKMQKLLRKQYQSGRSAKYLEDLCKKIAQQNGIELESSKKKERMLFEWGDDTPAVATDLKDSLKHVLTQLHAGVLAINPKNGGVKCWVGGIDFQHYPYDQINAKRQLASTFKPFLYASALELGVEPCEYLSNESIKLEDYNNWSPQNYDGSSGGKYSFAASLARSKNIPTLHLFFRLNQDSLANLWNRMGFIDELSRAPSAIYGTNSVSLLELVTAYSSFANLGKLPAPYTIESIEDANGKILYQKKRQELKAVISQRSSLMMNEILAKAIREGTGVALKNQYGVTGDWAGKTGTSQNYADAWFVCYNEELVIASRVGASYPGIHFNSGALGSGSKLALPIVAQTLKNCEDKSLINGSLRRSREIDCPDFKEESTFEKILNIFSKDTKSLKEAKEKAKKDEKRKGLLKILFGK